MSTIIKARRVEFRSVPSEPHLVADAVAHNGSEAGVSAPDTLHEKAARLLQLDGEVVGVEFTCSCGETSVLEFRYDPPEAGGSESAAASTAGALLAADPPAPLPSVAPAPEEDPS